MLGVLKIFFSKNFHKPWFFKKITRGFLQISFKTYHSLWIFKNISFFKYFQDLSQIVEFKKYFPGLIKARGVVKNISQDFWKYLQDLSQFLFFLLIFSRTYNNSWIFAIYFSEPITALGILKNIFRTYHIYRS